MLRVASWNVNSLRIRLSQVLDWLKLNNIDILALQETKLLDEHFPTALFREQGYEVAFVGQKSYNGVALISRYPIEQTITAIPQYDDPQRRFLAATIAGLRIINLYVPNGFALDSDKYTYKLSWLQKTLHFIKEQLANYQKLLVVGDFNIAPEDIDVHNPAEWQHGVMVSTAERAAFSHLLSLGLIDSFRHFSQEEQMFSWWDYRAGSFRRNRGLRIDHILMSESLTGHCRCSHIDKIPRDWPRPSDHAPLWVELSTVP